MRATSVSGRPGGTGANAAIALASTGAAVHLVGYVGDDEPGATMRAVLAARGVDTRFVHIRGDHTSEVVILVEASGDRSIIDLRPTLLHTVAVPARQVRPGDVVYFATWRAEFLPAIGQIIAHGGIVATAPPPQIAPDCPATYLIGSKEQYKGQNPTIALSGGAATPRAVIVTLGADGVIVHERTGSAAYPAQPVTAVDTTGAGDAFAAAFLRQISVGDTLGRATAAGLAWAAAAVQSPSSVPPPWTEVRDRVMARLSYDGEQLPYAASSGTS